MRSELIILPKNYSRFQCNTCVDLGYISRHSVRDNVFLNQLSNLKFSMSNNIVLHLSSLKNSTLIEELSSIAPSKQISYIACQHCFDELKECNSGVNPIALIITDEKCLHEEFDSRNLTLNFLITEKTNVRNFLSLANRVGPKLSFFTKFNVHNSYKLSALVESIRNLDFAPKYETPFGHDQIDDRNPDHIHWIFEPNSMFSSLCTSDSAPLISIVIPFYNRSDLVRKVLISLARQNLEVSQFEVILLDDGSLESEKLKLLQFLRSVPLQISYQFVNRDVELDSFFIGNRVGPIRNLGIHLARAEIVLFLDSDILVPPTFIEDLIERHKLYDVLLPRRIYLNESASLTTNGADTHFFENDRLNVSWEAFLNKIFKETSWTNEPHPWKYFMTYALSVKKSLLIHAGGFRTNYISYGYEDLDLGYRIMQLTKNYFAMPEEVYHLYHFNSGSEYDLRSYKRYFQLVFSSRMFTLQNSPKGKHDLVKMREFRTISQKIIFLVYRIVWQLHKLVKAI